MLIQELNILFMEMQQAEGKQNTARIVQAVQFLIHFLSNVAIVG